MLLPHLTITSYIQLVENPISQWLADSISRPRLILYLHMYLIQAEKFTHWFDREIPFNCSLTINNELFSLKWGSSKQQHAANAFASSEDWLLRLNADLQRG